MKLTIRGNNLCGPVLNAKLIGAVQEGLCVLEAWGSYTSEGSLRRLGFDGCGMNGSQAISPGWTTPSSPFLGKETHGQFRV